jgi:hypothetical protein
MIAEAATRIVSRLLEGRVFATDFEAARSVPASGWRDWQSAGVQFSSYHKDRTPSALPFRPDDYLWAGPFTLKIHQSDLDMGKDYRERGIDFHLGHYQRGVKKYMNRLAKGLKLPPVVLLYHDAWGWTMQDGNHRYEALVKAGATTYDAFLGKPKKKKPIDSF